MLICVRIVPTSRLTKKTGVGTWKKPHLNRYRSQPVKHSIKYPIALLLLLLVGYSQVYVRMCAGWASSTNTGTETTAVHLQAWTATATPGEDIYIEEEDRREDEWSTAADFSMHVTSLIATESHQPLIADRSFLRYQAVSTLLAYNTSSAPSYLEICVVRL